MTQNTILILQAALSFLQVINAGLVTLHPPPPPLLQLSIAGAIGGVQTYLQNVGNKSIPPESQQPKTEDKK